MLPLMITFTAYSQSVISDGSIYMIQVGNTGSANGFVHQLKVGKSNDDSVHFEITGEFGLAPGEYLKVADKIFKYDEANPVLLYDYKLDTGNVFYFDGFGRKDSFSVDSMKMIKTLDGIERKQWFLNLMGEDLGKDFTVIWVEGLGEGIQGWDWTNYGTFHMPFVQAICQNEDVISWRGASGVWKGNQSPEASCDFEALDKLLGTNEASVDLGFSVYPNPTDGGLSIESREGLMSISIFSQLGELMQLKAVSGDHAQIDLSGIPKGVYLIQAVTKKGSATRLVVLD